MNEEVARSVAAQLRKPHGEHANEVGRKMNEGNLHINMHTLHVLSPVEGDRILELGMGNGFFVKDIMNAHETIHYTGCDFSPEMVAEAEKINAEYVAEGRASFLNTHAHDLPFNEGSFHKIFTVNTLYFWEDPVQVLASLRRVLKPGGKLIIAIRPESVMQHYPFTPYGFTMYSKEKLENLLALNGFTQVTSLEKEEPFQEINGEKQAVETLIVTGIKS